MTHDNERQEAVPGHEFIISLLALASPGVIMTKLTWAALATGARIDHNYAPLFLLRLLIIIFTSYKISHP